MTRKLCCFHCPNNCKYKFRSENNKHVSHSLVSELNGFFFTVLQLQRFLRKSKRSLFSFPTFKVSGCSSALHYFIPVSAYHEQKSFKMLRLDGSKCPTAEKVFRQRADLEAVCIFERNVGPEISPLPKLI